MSKNAMILILISALLSACSSLKNYDEPGPDNFVLQCKGRACFSLTAIFEEAPSCNRKFMGKVTNQKSLHLPIGKEVIIIFGDGESSPFTGQSYETGTWIRMTPKSGTVYKAVTEEREGSKQTLIYSSASPGGPFQRFNGLGIRNCSQIHVEM